MRCRLLFLVTVFWFQNAQAQFLEDFEREDLWAENGWTGDTAEWKIKEGKLNSNYIHPGGATKVFYSLSTSSESVKSTVWEFWVKTKTTSGNNYVHVHLVANHQPLREEQSDQGYFVKIGGTKDQVALYKKDGTDQDLLIEGRDGITENAILKIKVVCDENYRWQLFTDISGSGNGYFSEGEAEDSSVTTGRYFGIMVSHSGKTVNEAHWFDEISIKEYVPDTLPPVLEEIRPRNERQLELYFSEPLSPLFLQKEFFLMKGQHPEAVDFLEGSASGLLLSFAEDFLQEEEYTLSLKEIRDLSGNGMDTLATFTFFTPERYDVIFSEIYPNPQHSNGLPEYEYVELQNTSTHPISLSGWHFCAKSRCKVLPEYVIEPQGRVILTDEQAGSAFAKYGEVLTVPSFPALNDNGSSLYLWDHKGELIHSVDYDKTSFGDSEKSNGGWALEMKNRDFPCLTAENWTASTASIGGTPGQTNSVDRSSEEFVKVESVNVLDPGHLHLKLNAELQEEMAKPQLQMVDQPAFQFDIEEIEGSEILVSLSKPLEKRTKYQLALTGIEACGLSVSPEHRYVIALPEVPEKGDLFLNEILFHPSERGKEFIEIFNASPKIIDLQSVFLADGRGGEIKQKSPFSETSFFLMSGQYAAVTRDKGSLLRTYTVRDPDNLIEVGKLPSYPNSSGAVVLLSEEEEILDRFDYTEEQHYVFFHSKTGVSLEKIHPTWPSNDIKNWESASSVYGYATPGYENSQRAVREEGLLLKMEPETFAPEGEGFRNRTFLTYELKPGYSANIRIFNEKGQLVRRLKTHVSLGTKGALPWDGRDDRGNLLSTGIYIFFVELYHPEGETISRKLPVVLVKQ